MKRFRVVLASVLILAVMGSAPLGAAEEHGLASVPAERPWALRDSYSFKRTEVGLYKFSDMGNLYLVMPDERMWLEQARFEVQLADGRVIGGRDLTAADSARTPFTHALGDGTLYRTQYAEHEGVAIHYQVRRFSQRGFLLLEIGIENRSAAPVGVSRIRPLIIDPGKLKRLSSETSVSLLPIGIRGGIPVFDRERPLMAVLKDPIDNVSVTIALLPAGTGSPRFELAAHGGAWQGEAVSDYAPAHVIAPGETLYSDALWVDFGPAEQSRVGDILAWTLGMQPYGAMGKVSPKAWISVPESGDARDLLRMAQTWSRAGVSHAVAPANWEGVPGSHEGGAPRYPRDISGLADNLRRLGYIPGITIDPLATQGARSGFVEVSADGQPWVNLKDPAGMAHAAERMRRLKGRGFTFFVVAPSRVPDAVLERFGMTRAEAEHLAMAAAVAGAGDAPVFPSAAATLDTAPGSWREVELVSFDFGKYDITIGPVRVEADGLDQVDPAVLRAMANWAGPIEILGAPRQGARTALGAMASAGIGGKSPNWGGRIAAPPRGGRQPAIPELELDETPAPVADEEEPAYAEDGGERRGGFIRNVYGRIRDRF